jgi:hypothetical protein
MGMGSQLLLLVGAIALVALTKYRYTLRTLVADWREFQAWRAGDFDDRAGLEIPPGPPLSSPGDHLDPTPLAGAGLALAQPPADFRAVLSAVRDRGVDRYRFPLGWYTGTTGGKLQTAQLQGDVNHMLITGQSNAGKDNAALGMLLALAHTHSPTEVQVAIIDGKGLDWEGWAGKAHTWLLASEPEEVSPAMLALSSERQRRRKVLRDAGASKLENYRGGDMPLLVIFVSELLLLENATSKSELTSWLNTELTSARACGMRYLIACQSATGFSTQWRSQISLFLAGFQAARHGDEPNTALLTTDIEALGAVPPSKLPAPTEDTAGVFCAVQGGQAVNVRASFIHDNQRDYLLAQLPAAIPKALQEALAAPPPMSIDDQHRAMLTALLVAESSLATSSTNEPMSSTRYSASERREAPATEKVAPSSGSTFLRSDPTAEPLPVAPELIPADEQRQILELAKRVSSRRALCKQLYNGATGGAAYNKVQQVCDAAGLLMPSQAVAA